MSEHPRPMAAGKTNLRELAALSTVLRGIVDGIKATGHPPVAAQAAALDAVDAFTQGAKLTKAQAKRLSDASFEEVKLFGSASLPAEYAARSANGVVRRLLAMAVGGDDDEAGALTYAGYALRSLRSLSDQESTARINDSYAKALEAHSHISDAPLAAKGPDAKNAAAEGDLLAKSRAVLPPYGQKLLEHIGAARDTKQVGTPEELRTMLAKHKYPVWPALVQFNEELGGLLIPSSDDKRWREENLYSVAGPYAGLAAGGDRMRRDGLVPVYFGGDDMIGFLDDKGEAWLGGVLDGQLTALHCSGAELVATCIAYELLQSGGQRLKGLVNKAGLVGEKVAKALSLEPIASYGPARMWASGDAVVSELFGETQLGACTDTAWTQMQGAVATLEPSVPDFFKTAKLERTLPNVERAFAALLAAIPGCENLADVKKLFSEWVLAVLQVNDGEPRWQGVASALVERAATMTPDEGGKAMGWIARQCGLASRLKGWEDATDRRDAWCEGVDEHIDLLRRWVKDESVERRTTAVYALAWCPSATKDDAELILSALGREKDATALATELVVVGWLSRSTGADRAAAVKALRGVGKAAPLVATCAVAGLVWLGEPLLHKEVDVLLKQLRRSTKLPAMWEMDDPDGYPGTGELARAALATMNVAEPDETVAAVRAMLAEPKLPRGAPIGLKAALARAAFDGRRAVPREGVALEELTPDERDILAVLIDGHRFTCSALGFDQYSLPDALEQKLPEWRPLEIVVGSTKRHWHFARIVGAVGVGQVTPDGGRDSVLAAFSPEAAAILVNTWSSHFRLIEGAMTPEERERALSLCLGILDATKAAAVDVDGLCRDYQRCSMPGALALWSIRTHGGRPPEDHYLLLERAMGSREWHAALLLEIRALPTDVRTQVLHHARPWILDFWAESLDEVTVPRIVLMAAENPKRIPEVIALLEQGGPTALALAEAVTSARLKVEADLAFFRDALRKRRQA